MFLQEQIHSLKELILFKMGGKKIMTKGLPISGGEPDKILRYVKGTPGIDCLMFSLIYYPIKLHIFCSEQILFVFPLTLIL